MLLTKNLKIPEYKHFIINVNFLMRYLGLNIGHMFLFQFTTKLTLTLK